MRFPGRRQGAAQIARGVALGAPGGHGVAEYLPAVLRRAVCGLDRAARFDAPENGQQFARGYLRHRPRADPREDVPFEPAQDLAGVVGGTVAFGRLDRLALLARIDVVRQQLARVIAPVAG